MPNAKAGDDGVEAEKIHDGDAMRGSFDGTLQPGKKATTDFAFDAPPEATNLDIERDQLFEFSTEPAFWELEI